MIVPQYGSSEITVFVWGKNMILKFVVNTKYKSMKLTLQLVVVVLIAPMKFRDNLFKFVILLESYCGTITEPWLPVDKDENLL